ncbi:MAG: WecB/TagA/CpsF family glycosyltransferase [Verrucomicrobia bacterium]|nr:WecB/TagA/CpsF family glycosyltransferase [Verrucomicrobiota bacterium]
MSAEPTVSERAACDRLNVLGVGISVLHRQQALELVLEAARRRQRGYICVTGVHGVMESQYSPEVRAIHNRALLCTPDGMPMVWMGWLKGHKSMGRVYGPDLMLDVCEASPALGLRHFFYGGANGAAAELQRAMTARFPGLQVVGVCEPPFRPLDAEEESALRAQVAAARPDILWVGLSTPKQERFMAEYLPKLDVTLMIGVGAAFDFHTGRVKQAPLWMRQTGMEWLYRLWREPRRLWRRYLRNNPRFVLLVLGQLLGLKRYTLD